MSTSGDGRAADAARVDPLLGSTEAAPGAELLGTVLDPAVLARIANELFAAAPGDAPAAVAPPSPEPGPPGTFRGALPQSSGSLRGAPAPSPAATSGVPSTASVPAGLPSSGGVPSSAEVLVPWLSGGGGALPGATLPFAPMGTGVSMTGLDPTPLRTMPQAGSIPRVPAGPSYPLAPQGSDTDTLPW